MFAQSAEEMWRDHKNTYLPTNIPPSLSVYPQEREYPVSKHIFLINTEPGG